MPPAILAICLMFAACGELAWLFPGAIPVLGKARDLATELSSMVAAPRLVPQRNAASAAPASTFAPSSVPSVPLTAPLPPAPPPPPPPTRGGLRIVNASSPCFSADGVNPGIRPVWREPRVGGIVRITWTTRACVVPAPPDDLAVLLLSLRPLDHAPQISANGCVLLVNPDLVMVPSYSPNALLRREPGRGIITLNWTPAPFMLGQTLWSQLFVFAPGQNVLGYLLSPALELVVGSPTGT